MARRVYWDSCTFLGLINQEPGKHTDSAAVWKEAEDGGTIIYTSFFTFAEVFKVKCEEGPKPLSEEGDKRVEQLLRQKWVRPVVVDERIGIAARRLMRHYPPCKKPSDGIHLATALALNVDEMHTYDGSDLLGLSGKINRPNGSSTLTICVPKPMPSSAAPEPPQLPDDDLFRDQS